MADDFCIDENAGVAYLTTHRENTIDCVSLDPAKNSERFLGVDFSEAPETLQSKSQTE